MLTELDIYAKNRQVNNKDNPVEINESLARFKADHPDASKVAFVMMRFGNTRAHSNIIKGIRKSLVEFGIEPLRADDKEYHADLLSNILTYIYGCSFGIAVFERIESEQHNPNVALEVGYMLALGKPICLLKDRSLATLHVDLIGRLYRTFDALAPVRTIPPELSSWVRERGMGGTPPP